MIEMGVGEQDRVDRARIEAEIMRVHRALFAPALEQAAIDEYALAGGLKEVAGAGDVLVRAVEREFHSKPPRQLPRVVRQSAAKAQASSMGLCAAPSAR